MCDWTNKCWSFLAVFLISCSFAISGVYTFNNADPANNNWSNPANWDGGVLPIFDSSCIVTQASATAIIDADVTIKSLIISESLNSDVIFSGTNKLSFIQDSSETFFIMNYCTGMLYLQGYYDFSNSVKTYNIGIIKNMKSGANTTFDTNSVTYFNNHTHLLGTTFNMLGKIKKSAAILKIVSVVTFGESAFNDCNINFELNSCHLKVNTSNLMTSGSFRTTWNGKLTINAADAVGGRPDLDPDAGTTYNFNGNADFGLLELSSGGTYTMVLNLGADVDYLTFEDCSATGWGGETLKINNFRSGIIRFGTDKRGLTATQLSQILADGAGIKGVELDANGWLIPLQPSGTVIVVQ